VREQSQVDDWRPQKQTCRNIASRSSTKEQRQFKGENIIFTKMVLEQLTIYLQKTESKHRPYTLHKNELKIAHRPKGKIQNY
jgi:hypothetical protein